MSCNEQMNAVWSALEAVTDPEIDESVASLGFVTRVDIFEGENVSIEFRLQTYWCAPNFAFLMASDMRDAVSNLTWVRSVSVKLLDHFSADLINRGVEQRQDFRDAFPGETDGDLKTIRRKFLGQAFQRRQEMLIRYLLRARYDFSWIENASLRDLIEAPIDDEGNRLRNLYLFMWRRIHVRSAEENERAFTTEDLEPLKADEMSLYLRKISAARHNAEFNGVFCRSVLAAREGPRTAYINTSPATANTKTRLTNALL
jgi:metal-sulfur cluster biosynthetic enzyme